METSILCNSPSLLNFTVATSLQAIMAFQQMSARKKNNYLRSVTNSSAKKLITQQIASTEAILTTQWEFIKISSLGTWKSNQVFVFAAGNANYYSTLVLGVCHLGSNDWNGVWIEFSFQRQKTITLFFFTLVVWWF